MGHAIISVGRESTVDRSTTCSRCPTDGSGRTRTSRIAIARVQDRLGRRIALENVSTYARVPGRTRCRNGSSCRRSPSARIAESSSISTTSSSRRTITDSTPMKYVDAIAGERVFQIHLAGPSEAGPLLVDTHDSPVRDGGLGACTSDSCVGSVPISTLIEWDESIPPLARVAERGGPGAGDPRSSRGRARGVEGDRRMRTPERLCWHDPAARVRPLMSRGSTRAARGSPPRHGILA